MSRTGLRAEANVGVRFALSRDGRDRLSSSATIAALCVATAALVGTLVFGSSLGRLVEDSARYGYNYGYVAGAPTGGPLGSAIIDAARTAPGVAGAMALSQASASIRGDDIDLVGVEPLRGGLLPVVLAGRFPASPDEVASGELTARSLHVHVGDDVAFDGADGGPVTYHVVGFVVLPSVSFGEGGGRGAAMISSGLQRMSPGAQPEQLALRLEPGIAPDAVALGQGRDAVDRADTAARGRERVPCPLGAHDHRGRGRPARVRGPPPRPPLIGPSACRLDIAVLRALGADRPWITRVVHIQASVLGLIALVIGVPVGIVAGRAAYRAFADRLGLVATPSMPIAVVGSLAIAVLVLANLSAAVPARRAARVPPSVLLHDQ